MIATYLPNPVTGTYFYDQQFRYIRHSAPDQYPWDTIYWELGFQAVINFRANATQSKPDSASPHTRPRQSFPKGTCWSLYAGKYCGGCKFEHICFKCGAKHPASQCSVVNQRRVALPKTGSTPSASHALKGGQTRISFTRLICFPSFEFSLWFFLWFSYPFFRWAARFWIS